MVETFLLDRWMLKRAFIISTFTSVVRYPTVAMMAAEAWGVDCPLTIRRPEESYEVDLCYLFRKI